MAVEVLEKIAKAEVRVHSPNGRKTKTVDVRDATRLVFAADQGGVTLGEERFSGSVVSIEVDGARTYRLLPDHADPGQRIAYDGQTRLKMLAMRGKGNKLEVYLR